VFFPTCFASTGIHSKYSISCLRFYCFQQTGEPASRSKLTLKASTSARNARFVHGSAPASVNSVVKSTGLLTHLPDSHRPIFTCFVCISRSDSQGHSLRAVVLDTMANGTGANCRSSSIRFGNTASIRSLRSTCTWRNFRITLTHVVAFMRQGHFHWLGTCIQVNRHALAQSLVLACRKRTGLFPASLFASPSHAPRISNDNLGRHSGSMRSPAGLVRSVS
jgi:hypothetical protein